VILESLCFGSIFVFLWFKYFVLVDFYFLFVVLVIFLSGFGVFGVVFYMAVVYVFKVKLLLVLLFFGVFAGLMWCLLG